ncbi:MAG TPA: membrane protein insertase YidC [Acetobacteraceae bacterium]|jgi:YidC/Oxa1 family membrane protein insertase
MEQKRLFLAITISIAILLAFQYLVAPHLPQPPAPPPQHVAAKIATPPGSAGASAPTPGLAAAMAQPSVPTNVPRVKIAAPSVRGSISLLGARIDDLILSDYRETEAPNSPHVRLLEPLSDPHPYYIQYGWTPGPGAPVNVPDNNTVWHASNDTLSAGHPVTLSWDNGQGVTFELLISIDDNYMFNVTQAVKNATGKPVELYPWARVRREYTPETAGYYILFEGLLGNVNGLQETTYAKAKTEGDKQIDLDRTYTTAEMRDAMHADGDAIRSWLAGGGGAALGLAASADYAADFNGAIDAMTQKAVPETGSTAQRGLLIWIGYNEYALHLPGQNADALTRLDNRIASAKRVEEDTGTAYHATTTGGWAGITDKYWLTAIAPDQSKQVDLSFIYGGEGDGHYQVDYVTHDPVSIAAGATGSMPWHSFAGAKIVHLLDHYEAQYHIPNFDKAVDFGWFYFLTKPIFLCLDWLNSILGNFGLAIIAFTTGVKLLFFPLANYSYRSMSKMKLLGPKVTALRERFKDDPQKMQSEMMGLYRAEGVNPASGCLPMVVQIPVFFSLYKVIFTTIEMRQAPFFGWIHDLSQPDPTNVFNLFGLIPFDPTTITPYLHLGILPLIMGGTMFLQQKLNPPPPDPVQARLFQFMPIIFTFMLARFPAGLVIYWTWNNLMSVCQQWVIMRRTRLSRPGLART